MPDAAARKAAERDRKRALGLVAVTVWVRPEHRDKIHEAAKKLNASRRKK